MIAPTVSFRNPSAGTQGIPLNTSVTIAFSESISCATVIGNITLDDNIFVPGTINVNPSCSNTTASITPLVPLSPNTVYTVSLSGVTDLNNNPVAAETWTFTTGPAADVTPPTVTFQVPTANATGVGINVSPTVVFSELMSCPSVNAASFRVKNTATGVYLVGSVNCFGTSATWTLDPLANPNFATNTQYTVEVNAGALDNTANLPLTPVASWNFTTGPGPDVTPPTIAFATPANGALGVPTNTGVNIAFNEVLNCGSILGGLTLEDAAAPGVPLMININCNGNTVSFTPIAPNFPLPFNTMFRVNITGAVTDLFDNAIPPQTWTFTTGSAPDVTLPTVSLVSPISASTGIPTNSNITVSFSETIQCGSLNFTINNGITGIINCAGSTATYVPNAGTPLLAGTNYTATIAAVQDVQGNSIGAPYSWNFTTGLGPDIIQPTVTIRNVRDKSVLESGFIIGTAADDRAVASVEISFNAGGSYATANGTTNWSYQLPTGNNTWKTNSLHDILVRSKDVAGNYSIPVAVSNIRKGTNKDVNGDGYGDMVASSYSEGLVYIFHSAGAAGITTTTSSSANRYIFGGAADQFGKALALGDINADGYADLVVGAPNYSAGAAFRGAAYVFYSSGIAGITTSFSAFAATQILGAAPNDIFGASLSTGDINGDGFSDLVVGAPSNNGASGGRVYIFHSAGATGITATDTTTAASSVIGNAAFTDYLGNSLATGNINGDAYDDVVIGAYNYFTARGRVFIYHGSTTGIAEAPTSTLTNTTGAANLDKFGMLVASGDINGDGNADVVVAAVGKNANIGRIFVFTSNGATGVTTTTSPNGVPLYISGVNMGDLFGMSILVKDLNGDGRADIVSSANNGGNGTVHVFMTPSVGGIGGTLDTSNAAQSLIGGLGFGLGSLATNPTCQISAGDVNGDGYMDLFIGNGQGTGTHIFHTTGAGLGTNNPAFASTIINAVPGGGIGSTVF